MNNIDGAIELPDYAGDLRDDILELTGSHLRLRPTSQATLIPRLTPASTGIPYHQLTFHPLFGTHAVHLIMVALIP